jgi:hypothetical protein
LVAFRHELWRDEVRALNIAAGSGSIADLFHNLRNEGHPPLWYLLLYAAFHATGSMLVLKPLSLGLAGASYYVFLRRAPWSLGLKALFALGIFPLYEYSVMCRNYGISMLLIFAAATLFPKRFTRPLPLAVVLALLANTNAYALIVVAALIFGMAVELRRSPPPRPVRRAEALLAAIVLGAAMAGSALVMLPDRRTSVTDLHTLGPASLAGPLLAALLVPGHLFFRDLVAPGASLPLHLLGGALSLLCTALLWLAAAALRPRVWLSAALLAAASGFALFSDVVYPSSTRHWGLLYLLGILLLWVAREEREAESTAPAPAPSPMRRLAFPLLLISQVGFAVVPVGADLFGAFSSSERLGGYLAGSPALREATVIGEPDYLLEALPYYAQNRIWLPREGRFLLKVSFTDASRPVLSLDELMAEATRLRRETGKPVVIVMGHELRPEGPFTLPAGFKNTFVCSPTSLGAFLAGAERLVRFDGAARDENYTVYLWKGDGG